MSIDLRRRHERHGTEPPVEPGDDGEGLFGGRAWTALGAAVVLGVIVLMGLWLTWGRGEEPAPATQPRLGMSSPTTSASALARPCPELPTSSEVPTAAPKAEWRIVYTVALPFSETAGPAVVQGDVARCYAHSPEGALFAAVQTGIRSIVARDGERVVRETTVAGPGQDALLAALRRRGWSSPAPGELCQTAGFQIASYTPERAVISLASRCGSDLQLTQTTVVWLDGDWRAELLPDGSFSATASKLPSLRGLVAWGGV